MIVIDRDAPWMEELAWLVAFLAELRHERAIIAREYLHSMVVVIGDEQETSMMVERQAHRNAELAISIALFLGANRELDSRIIVEITFHLIQEKRLQPSTQENRHKRERWYCTRGGVCVCVMRRVCGQQANERTNQPTNDRNIQQHDDASLCSCASHSLVYLSCLLAFVPSSSAIANSHSLSKVKISLL